MVNTNKLKSLVDDLVEIYYTSKDDLYSQERRFIINTVNVLEQMLYRKEAQETLSKGSQNENKEG